MDVKKASQEIMELFIQAAHRYHALEKIPAKTQAKHDLYHSERHWLDKIGSEPGMNVTEFARAAGITKGAVSQVVKKLEAKGFVRRYKGGDNNKEVFLELTRAGRELHVAHRKKNEETIKPLVEELKKYPDGSIKGFISLLAWISGYLEESREQMKGHK